LRRAPVRGARVESWNAASLLGRAKALAWNDFYSQHVEKVSFAVTDQSEPDPWLEIRELGPIRIVQLICGRCTIERPANHIGQTTGRAYTFILQARGRGLFTQYGHEAALEPGDFALCHGEAPYTYQLGSASEVAMLRVPVSLLKEHMPSAESFCGRRLPAGEGLAEAAATLINSLCAPRSVGLSEDFQHRLARQLLDMIATSYAIAFDTSLTTSSNVDAWHARAKLFIEQHLCSPDLTPCEIASRLKLSPRYLRMIFASGDETVSAYILRRRLEECARQIEDPRWSGHSITEIAFSWGFNSAPHFTRSFRDRYATTPRGYRHRSLKSPRPAGLSMPTSTLPPPALPLPAPTRPGSC
jgi:AraC family transcriptional regulator, positive regulator of tynA and feaB